MKKLFGFISARMKERNTVAGDENEPAANPGVSEGENEEDMKVEEEEKVEEGERDEEVGSISVRMKERNTVAGDANEPAANPGVSDRENEEDMKVEEEEKVEEGDA